MFDRALQGVLKAPMARAATLFVRMGIGANTLSFIGFGLGLAAAASIANGHFLTGLALMLLSRLMDGVDGAVARATRPTDRGSFLDITLDFLFYAFIPLAFAWHNPASNALPAAVLLTTFIGTGSSFLAFAIVAAQRRMSSLEFPDKGFYFLGGLTEATETLIAFAAMCLWPGWFPQIALGFALLCAITTVLRIGWGYRRFD